MTDYETMLAIFEKTFGKVSDPRSGLKAKQDSYILWETVEDDGVKVVELSFTKGGVFEGFSHIRDH